jgi:hypothetical protein
MCTKAAAQSKDFLAQKHTPLAAKPGILKHLKN